MEKAQQLPDSVKGWGSTDDGLLLRTAHTRTPDTLSARALGEAFVRFTRIRIADSLGAHAISRRGRFWNAITP